MKRSLGIVAGVIVVLGVLAAIFVLPSYRLKSGLDELIASLPPGVTFTYRDAHYAVFARRVTLDDVVLKLADPAMDIHIDAIEIDHGNPGLGGATATARRSPDMQNAETTPIADRIVLTGLHTTYGPADITIGREEVDGAAIDLRQVFAPLPAIDASRGDSAPYPSQLQKTALYMVAAVYKHAEVDDFAVMVQTGDGRKVAFRAAALTSDGFDHGNIASTALKGFDIASGTFDLHVDTIAAGDTMHRDFWTALRDGAPLDSAVEKFQGTSQTIENVKATSNGKPIGSLDKLTVGNIGYRAGLPVSLDIDATNLTLDPALLPQPGIAHMLEALGYKTVTLNGHVGYAWDQAAQTIRLDPATLTMDQGGTLTLTASMTGADPKLPFNQYKLAGATARYDDASLVTKWLAYVAAQTKQTPKTVQDAYARWLEQQQPAFKTDPALSAAFPALEAFIEDPHSLLVTLAPPQPVSLSDFNSAMPQMFTGRLGLTVTAPGSAPFTPVPVPVAPPVKR